MATRRAFIKASGLSIFGASIMGNIPDYVFQAAVSQTANSPFQKQNTLVCIFQRGAMDGLMAVSPFNDPFLKQARPSLFIKPGTSGTGLIDLDGTFGLHPALKGFQGLFGQGRLAIVQGIGSPNATRSHFDAQDYMETGTPFRKGTDSGWLNRSLSNRKKTHVDTPFSAVSLTSALPRSLYGKEPAIAISNLQDFAIQLKGNPGAAQAASERLEDLYDQTAQGLLQHTGKDSFEAMSLLQKTDLKGYKPEAGVRYPNSALGNSLKQIAQLIKMEVGLEIGFAESNGWDTHFNQGTVAGVFARNLLDFNDSICAFWEDLGAFQDQVTVMSMTEFGRTVKQNGTGGTDHGRASCNFILGHNVVGGRVYGTVSPLAPENLEDGRDLKVTTDYRAVFAEVAGRQLGIDNISNIFPDWEGQYLGLMKR
ncbi:DUF1501 domain-containing protein [Dyadobacter tibetensis]|uniref:DUF1501 domain-containing protein n=1 Tax=Dyadobacter tibetensis TaxID=1211851 RepID=UPI0004712027|nr:DUF1501 domain-containing protein [Dyadobacter tibetensis]